MTRPAVSVDRVLDAVSRFDRRPIMIHLRRAVGELLDRFPEELVCLETGTIRSYNEEHESTRHIAEALEGRGRLISVDLSGEAIEVSRSICGHLDNVEWVQSDSRSYLASLAQPLHLALLDSANDSDLIFDEFRLVLPHIVAGGIVMVDDAGSRPGPHESARASSAVKGRRVWQLLDSAGAAYRLLRTPRAHGRQIKVVLDPSNRRKILDVLEVQRSCA